MPVRPAAPRRRERLRLHGDGDCHLLVIHDTQKKLYEMWRTNITGGTFYGGCATVWDLTRDYVPHGRGEGCTSATPAATR